MRWLNLVLPLSLLVTACAPAVLPGIHSVDSPPRISLMGSSLSVSLGGLQTTQALPATWDSGRITVTGPHLLRPFDSGLLLVANGPLSHTFAIPPGEVRVQVELLHSGQIVASGSTLAEVGPGENSVVIEMSTLITTISTFVGSGANAFADGKGTEASFHGPMGLALDDLGNLYVADYYNSRIRKVTPDGQVITIAGPGHFQGPTSLAFDPNTRKLYVSDHLRNEIRIVHLDRNPGDLGFITTLAGSGMEGDADGLAVEASFNSPQGLALHGDSLIVADTGNHRIRLVSLEGEVSTLTGTTWGHDDGPLASAKFNAPNGVTVSPGGRIYVSEFGNHAVRMIDGDQVSTLAGGLGSGKAVGDGGPTGSARFDAPGAIVWGAWGSAAGSVFVMDTNNNRICRLDLSLPVTDPAYVTEFMGGSGPGPSDGPPDAAQFDLPNGMVVEPMPPQALLPATYFYVSDTHNHRIVRGIFAGAGPQGL